MSNLNPLKNWIDEDSKLRELLEEISKSNNDISIQAKVGFYKISEVYNAPKYNDSFTEEHYTIAKSKGFDNPTCVSEEIAKLKYLYPKDDIRGIVLMAIYNTIHQVQFDIFECAKKKFRKIPKEFTILYIGEDIESHLYFPKKGDNWIELNAKSMSKITSS